jgi:DNA-binding transcriptional LysR family regulator
LRLTAPPPAADCFLGSAIPRFLAQYPEISLDLSFNDALTDIVAERFDAGIRIGERIERDMIAVRITDELPLVVAGSPAYFAQRGKPKSPKDLVAHDCIRTRFASGTYLPWRFRVKRRDLEVHVEGRLVVNSVSLARRAAVEGLALTQTPLVFIASDLSEGTLTTVLEQWAPTPVTGFFLYYPSRRQMRPALKALVRFSTRRAPWRVQATLAMNRQETAIGNGSRLHGVGGPGRAVPGFIARSRDGNFTLPNVRFGSHWHGRSRRLLFAPLSLSETHTRTY